MWEDPIVKEVREAGARIAKECDYDMHKFFELMRKHHRKSGKKTVTKEELKKREPINHK
jgi:hypothetical protein